jgi:hypothetical protein
MGRIALDDASLDGVGKDAAEKTNAWPFQRRLGLWPFRAASWS